MHTLFVIAVASLAVPHELSTRVVDGPGQAPAMQLPPPPPLRTTAPALPSAFTMPSDGNFHTQSFPRTKPIAQPGLVGGSFSMPGFEGHRSGALTTSGVPLKETSLREETLDTSKLSPASLTAKSWEMVNRSTPPRAAATRPTASYGPSWLMVDVNSAAAAPPDALHPGLSKIEE